jgi:GTP:adenosylcobinamide-phosphate guanylyltransferase
MMHGGERLGAMEKLLIAYCGLETLCRVCEKINVLAEEDFEQ